MLDLGTFGWSATDIPLAIQALSTIRGIPARRPDNRSPVSLTNQNIDLWIQASARWQGVDCVPVQATYSDIAWIVQRVGSLLVQVPDAEEPRHFIAIVRTAGSTAFLLTNESQVRRAPLCDVIEALCPSLAPLAAASLDRLLVESDLPRNLWGGIRAAFLADHLAEAPLRGCWMIRVPPGAPLRIQLRQSAITIRTLTVAIAYLMQYGLWIASWWIVGRVVLTGRADAGWFDAWALLLVMVFLLRSFVSWMQGLVAISTGALLKRRLMEGVLRLEPDETRHMGVGQILSRVIESEAIESLALSGGFLALFAGLELIASMWILTHGSAGTWHSVGLAGWAAIVLLLQCAYYRQRREWTAGRTDLTHQTVETMLGHRTRLAQEHRETRHLDEDDPVERSISTARSMDATDSWLRTVGPRGWLLVGVMILAPSFVAGTTTGALVIGVGGVLLAYQAFRKLTLGLAHLSGATIAWQSVKVLFDAASRPDALSPPYLLATRELGEETDYSSLIAARDVTFRYPSRPRPVLTNCSLTMKRGARVLIEGPSGGGKSTLATILGGIRIPEAGSLSLSGIDRRTFGNEAWRSRVVVVPQFHENHLLVGPLAFNLLLGRQWPPTRQDLNEAETICRELGLGNLLSRLPAGLMQMVGETGWQLSHGERSRVFIARSLLQNASLVILDESFGALDPETLRQAMTCVLTRAKSVIVMAHP
jgi:ABC-type multidrug transport system fused ATPase/permease subunit